MKKLMIALIVLLFIQCKTKSTKYYPPANSPDFIKDSFYYCRDTINFYEVEMSQRLTLTLDSIFDEVPMVGLKNYSWTIEITDKSFSSYTMVLAQDNCEEFFMDIELTNSVYKAINIDGRSVLIIDPYDVFKVVPGNPFIKIRNPRELKAIYNIIGRPSWLFKLDRSGELKSVEQ